LSPLNRPVSQV